MKDLSLNKETMSSLEIAELTGKQHAHVMRDIRNMIDNLEKSNQSTSGSVDYSSDFHRSDRTQYNYLSEKSQKKILGFCFRAGNESVSEYIIKESSYKDAKGEMRSMYALNKKASLLLASGYDVLLRAKIIDRWEELELDKSPKTLSPAEIILQQSRLLVENERKMRELEATTVKLQNDLEEVKQRTTANLNQSTIVAYVTRNNIKLEVTKYGAMGRKATSICKKRGIEITKINDVRWGMVSVYPDSVLDEVFNK